MSELLFWDGQQQAAPHAQQLSMPQAVGCQERPLACRQSSRDWQPRLFRRCGRSKGPRPVLPLPASSGGNAAPAVPAEAFELKLRVLGVLAALLLLVQAHSPQAPGARARGAPGAAGAPASRHL